MLKRIPEELLSTVDPDDMGFDDDGPEVPHEDCKKFN